MFICACTYEALSRSAFIFTSISVFQDSKSFIEQRLLEIKGVISFTFDISRHRCFVRTRNEVNAEVCVRIDNNFFM